jgi:DNA polymerase-1
LVRQPTIPGCDGLVHQPVPKDWRPDELCSLDGISELAFDTETDGLRWWDENRPGGLSVAAKGLPAKYFPWGHQGGGNLPEERVKEWARRELRGKRIVCLNTRFDVHMMREWGVDLVEQGCTFGDVGHYAALLDDNRRSFNLESVSQTYLHRGKVEGLSSEHMMDYHAYEVTPYAREDVQLLVDLLEKMEPLLDEENLTDVAALEDSVIPVVLEMERNASILDVPKLNRWVLESEIELNRMKWELVQQAGFKCDPAKNGDMVRLFESQHIPIKHFSEKTGKPSFDAAVMKAVSKTNPVADLAYRISKLTSLRSKYLVCYSRAVDHKGRLRSSFHQLRADAGGTVSGRFSSSAPISRDPTSGVNIQQIFATAKQIAMNGDRWIIRELFIPGSGLFYGSDAEQIEFRLFAHYSGSEKLYQAYRDDPMTDFHNIVLNIIRPVRPQTTRKLAKDCNFAKIYGAGQAKVAEMLGLSPEDAKPFVDTYDAEFPEAGMLMRKAMNAARTRGWVKTMVGRRARFPERQFLHSALNRVIQGSAADIMKKKLVELYNERKRLGLTLRATVHDEVVGDVPDAEAGRRADEVLDRQTTPTHVPILWGGKTGANWRECK